MSSTARVSTLAGDILHAFDDLNGSQPGYRAAHAKGILIAGTFTPSADAESLTRAPHMNRRSTPVTVRFSDFAGIPTVADNSPQASPRGMAIRFHLAEHVHTDIVAHSTDGFPVRTAAEMLEFLRALRGSGPEVEHPTPIEEFLGSHPAALEFVQTAKPMPASFSKESFYAVSAYRFVNREGASQFGRYRIRPEGAGEYLNADMEAGVTADFLFDEIRDRIAEGPVRMRIAVQLAMGGDVTDDSTAHWPKDRPEIGLGTLELTQVVENNDAEQRHIIFDPIPRVEGIEASADPLLEPRADVYLLSGRRRRGEGPK